MSGKIEPRDLQKVELKWSELTELLNSSGTGPVKSVQQWKKVVNELKTNIKKRAREIHVENIGTGGGPRKIKQLTDIEERLLALISKVVIEGAPIVEADGLNLADDEIEMNPEIQADVVVDREKIIVENAIIKNPEKIHELENCEIVGELYYYVQQENIPATNQKITGKKL